MKPEVIRVQNKIEIFAIKFHYNRNIDFILEIFSFIRRYRSNTAFTFEILAKNREIFLAIMGAIYIGKI